MLLIKRVDSPKGTNSSLSHHQPPSAQKQEPGYDSKSVRSWSTEDVQDWIQNTREGRYKHYAKRFADVKGSELATLTDADLKRRAPNNATTMADDLEKLRERGKHIEMWENSGYY